MQLRNAKACLDPSIYYLFTNNSADPQERLTFLSGVEKKVDNTHSQDAFVYATVAITKVKLELGDLEGARKDLDKAEKILDNFDSVEEIVHASFYRVNAEYYQVSLIGLTKGSSNSSSQNTILLHTTETPFSTLPVSTSRT